ncbi:hypothetical protein ACFQ88_36540, partial [Paenibacillus sp. NPDC056579]|uniref:hypothetical protein n=1 Tax=Paenibacillus sp. NPDC056579 TaxID=3345871 RepID=UPI0036C0ACD1
MKQMDQIKLFIRKYDSMITSHVILLLILLFPLIPVGYTTNDDIRAFISASSLSEIFHNSLDMAINQGRFSMIVTSALAMIPFLIDNTIYYKIVSFGSIIINYLLFSYSVYYFFKSKKVTFIASLFFIVFLQNSWEHNLVTSYPFVFHTGLDFLLISLILYKKYLVEKQKISITISVCSLIICTLCYEMFLPYLILFFIVSYVYSENRSIKKVIFNVFPVIIYFIVYVLLYLGFRIVFPSSYSGVQVGQFSLLLTLKVIYQFSIASIPGYIIFANDYYMRDFSQSFAQY